MPRLANAGKQKAVLAEAVKSYEAQAKVVDSRLYRKVSLEAKGEALSDVCKRLAEQTGVELRASRAVEDEKVTLFVKEVRARDLMRAVARLFGYAWSRSGAEGAYRYELSQDLRSQLAEEELRNRDQREALLALDAEMEKYRPFTEVPFDQLKQQWEQRETNHPQLFNAVIGGGWGGMKLYARLTPTERAALLSGQNLMFRPDHPDPERRIPAEWQPGLLASWNSNVTGPGGELVPVEKVPGIRITQLRLRLVRSELGQLTLKLWATASWQEKGGQAQTFNERELAIGRSPSVASPANAEANAALKGQEPFTSRVSFEPVPSCPHFRPGVKRVLEDPQDAYRVLESQSHVVTADVWEAVHRATGFPIVADSYSRLFPTAKLAQKEKPLFDALCQVADRMGVRWTKDGDFLLGRSTSYFWDKLKEVPNRHLQRWRKDQEMQGGLPLEDLVEMAHLSDQQLGSRTVGDVVRHCWGLRSWQFVEGEESVGRAGARFLPQLSAPQLRQAQLPTGIPVLQLSPGQQQGVLQLYQEVQKAFERQGSSAPPMTPELFRNASFQLEYVPAGWYLWAPSPEQSALGARKIAARTADEVLAKARQQYPAARPGQVARTRLGQFNAGVMFVFSAER